VVEHGNRFELTSLICSTNLQANLSGFYTLRIRSLLRVHSIIPIERQASRANCSCFAEFIGTFVPPNIIQCENGKEFKGALLYYGNTASKLCERGSRSKTKSVDNGQRVNRVEWCAIGGHLGYEHPKALNYWACTCWVALPRAYVLSWLAEWLETQGHDYWGCSRRL
jgi:hypothetical protein